MTLQIGGMQDGITALSTVPDFSESIVEHLILQTNGCVPHIVFDMTGLALIY